MDPIETPDARLERLARHQQRLSALVALLACGWLLSLAWQLAPRPNIGAEQFMLHDEHGTFLGGLSVRTDHAPLLRLNDAAGHARLYAVVTPNGQPHVRWTDAQGVHRMILELDDASRPRLELEGPDGRPRVLVSVDESGQPWAEFRLGRFQKRVQLVTGDTLNAPVP